MLKRLAVILLTLCVLFSAVPACAEDLDDEGW